ncbi:hypothetical protein HPIN_02825 [Helicobacter pylori India7]|uniref:Uncharacterized protein n=1 Tax=Helicobacter pylori (strain India7) TaxID=907238 RepID=E8QFP9_HELP7|nr:hypothetical protein HPIN_02825 [Helicobacter pylori India7]
MPTKKTESATTSTSKKALTPEGKAKEKIFLT